MNAVRSWTRLVGTYRQSHALKNLVVRRRGVRKMHVLEVVGVAPVLRSLFTVVVSLTNSPVKRANPEVIVGGLICLGKAWKLLVTRPQRAWSLPLSHGLTAGKTESQRGGLAGEENTHKRHDELIEADFPIIDQLRSPPIRTINQPSRFT